MNVGERTEAVEHGLLPVISIRGKPRQRMSLAARMAELHVPGASVAVVNDGRIEWAKGYGVLKQNGPPVNAETLFQACSISKVIAATGALVLVDRGLLDLDQPVNERLTSWQLPENEHTQGHPVTLRWLLSHRAGTTVSGVPAYEQGASIPTMLQTLDGLPPAMNAPIRVEHQPGSRFQYSGGGTTIAQQLIEDVTGRPYAEFIDDIVLQALQMSRSFYEHPLSDAPARNAAAGHRAGGASLAGGWFLQPQLAAAGLWTAPSDLARWAISVQQSFAGVADRPLSQRTAHQMLTMQGDGPTGLGLYLAAENGVLRLSHTGSNEGYRCELVAYASLGFGAVVMTNSDSGDRLCTEILNGIAGVYDWPDYIVEKTLALVDPATYERLVGTYEVNQALKLTVRRDGDRLLGEATGFGEHELLPESETNFFLTDAVASLTFDLTADGSAQALTLRALGLELPAKRVS